MTENMENQRSHTDYTVACICPMGVELAAVLGMLDHHHTPLPTSRDHNAYRLGTIGDHHVAVAVMPEVGNSAAANVAGQLMNDFPAIRFGLLVGIGGGVPDQQGEHDIRLGDVVVSKPSKVSGGVIQYDLGKRLTNGQFQRTGYLNKPPRLLTSSVEMLSAMHEMEGNRIAEYVNDMVTRYPRMATRYSFPRNETDQLFDTSYPHQQGSTCLFCDSTRTVSRIARTDREPQVHYGNIGSANLVVKDAEVRDTLRDDMDIICIDMEAAGLMDSFPCLVIRGISDYADSHKNSRWQPYAAATAAAYMKEILSIIPARDLLGQTRAKRLLNSADNHARPRSELKAIDHTKLDQVVPIAEAVELPCEDDAAYEPPESVQSADYPPARNAGDANTDTPPSSKLSLPELDVGSKKDLEDNWPANLPKPPERDFLKGTARPTFESYRELVLKMHDYLEKWDAYSQEMIEVLRQKAKDIEADNVTRFFFDTDGKQQAAYEERVELRVQATAAWKKAMYDHSTYLRSTAVVQEEIWRRGTTPSSDVNKKATPPPVAPPKKGTSRGQSYQYSLFNKSTGLYEAFEGPK